MILSDVTIRKYIESGKISVLPEINPSDIRPTGIRVHFGNEILLAKENQTVDLANTKELDFESKNIDSGFLLKPSMFVLGVIDEKIMTSRDLICRLEGRSTIARLGLSIHCTSGLIDGNYEEPRSIVLEMKNEGHLNIMLRPKIPIGLITFEQLTESIEQPSQLQYKGQSSVAAPNLKFKL